MDRNLKIAICDDEKPIRDHIKKCVLEIDPFVTVEQYQDAASMVSASFDADILFLDIRMPGMDGMKAARILRTMGNRTVIVFVTAMEEYVFKAFDVGAVQYIVKPFDRNRLIDTIKKAMVLAEEKINIDSALAQLNGSDEVKRSITIRSGGINRRVILAEILYAEVLEHRIILHMKDKERIEYYGKMSDLEKAAGEDFFRVHRAYLINLAGVRSYDSKAVTVSGEDIPVARGKYRELVKAYLSYHTRKENL
ncbi:MAG: LytTR family DNA-binding domain-containing protein [Lachnospiraceae bacterium]|nr:LytTR family DNA-binding domain-containing protein [Lachnospiraceae bacterium]